MTTAPPAPSVLSGRRPSLTGRAAMLALVVCLLAISLAYPMREYLAQRGDLTAYRAQVATQAKQVAELTAQHQRWQDPAYVSAQARERLHYVLPGETAYVVLGKERASTPDGIVEPHAAAVQRRPWFTDLWHTVEVAGYSGVAGRAGHQAPAAK